MAAYYNEIEPFAAQWLRNLITRDLIAPGDVDERSITEVKADDLRGYDQCHFFAGIGGWSYALRLAGVPDDRPVWTGSCPCQPFSAAGKLGGIEDERHLWPAFFRLIRECRPATVFGEQVAGAAGLAWLDHVHADLEGAGYAVAAADLPACSVGAPHRRQRLWWVADSDEGQRGRFAGSEGSEHNRAQAGRQQGYGEPQCGRVERMADNNGMGWRGRRAGEAVSQPGEVERSERCGDAGKFGDASRDRRFEGRAESAGQQGRSDVAESGASGANPWRGLEWLPCSDGKARPTQPGLFPLAHGIPGRVGRLRAYGNAIVPQVAAEFVKASIDCMP